MDRSSRQKLINIINQLIKMGVYRLIYPTTRYTFFSCLHKTSSKTDHFLGHKTDVTKFKTIEIIQRLLSDSNKVKLEINIREVAGKSPNTWSLNNTFLNNTWAEKIIQEKLN